MTLFYLDCNNDYVFSVLALALLSLSTVCISCVVQSPLPQCTTVDYVLYSIPYCTTYLLFAVVSSLHDCIPAISEVAMANVHTGNSEVVFSQLGHF